MKLLVTELPELKDIDFLIIIILNSLLSFFK